MPGVPRGEIDKTAIGDRIKRLRKEAGLRQWQLAELIGATQPAIHMYEKGVLPEPKRLLELARIGNTTVEWILTGRHWENGSEEMRRVAEPIYDLAFRFQEFSEEDRRTLEEAMRIINAAVRDLKKARGAEAERPSIDEIARQLEESAAGSLDPLREALSIHLSVCRSLLAMSAQRLRTSSLRDALPDAGAPSTAKGPEGRATRIRTGNMEPVRGNIFKLEGPLLALDDLMKDRELRVELEEALERLLDKLESKKGKSTRKSNRRGPH